MLPLRILVVGQTPPPFGGQAIMIQLLLDGAYDDIELVHVRMNFSKELKSTGKLKLAKLWELFRVIAAIYRVKLIKRPKVLYYPPSGPSFVPVIRDIVVLGMTRYNCLSLPRRRHFRVFTEHESSFSIFLPVRFCNAGSCHSNR